MFVGPNLYILHTMTRHAVMMSSMIGSFSDDDYIAIATDDFWAQIHENV